jgi:hypothetical protein
MRRASVMRAHTHARPELCEAHLAGVHALGSHHQLLLVLVADRAAEGDLQRAARVWMDGCQCDLGQRPGSGARVSSTASAGAPAAVSARRVRAGAAPRAARAGARQPPPPACSRRRHSARDSTPADCAFQFADECTRLRERRAAAGVVDDLSHDALDVAVALGEVLRAAAASARMHTTHPRKIGLQGCTSADCCCPPPSRHGRRRQGVSAREQRSCELVVAARSQHARPGRPAQRRFRRERTTERSFAAPLRWCVCDVKMDPLPFRWQRMTRPMAASNQRRTRRRGAKRITAETGGTHLHLRGGRDAPSLAKTSSCRRLQASVCSRGRALPPSLSQGA